VGDKDLIIRDHFYRDSKIPEFFIKIMDDTSIG
jgi:hypothetical protein